MIVRYGAALLIAGAVLAAAAGSQERGLEAGTLPQTVTEPTTGMEFVFIKGGCYEMGDTFGDGGTDEQPVHNVCVDDFYLGTYEVTNAQFSAFVEAARYR